jgi:pilus assembly protein CpaE
MGAKRVQLLTTSADWFARVARDLADHDLAALGSACEVAEWASPGALEAEAFIIDLDTPGDGAWQWLRQAEAVTNDLVVLGLSAQPTMEMALQSMRLGVIDLRSYPVEIPALIQSLEQAMAVAASRKEGGRARGSQVITFFSGKGGTGVTLLTANVGALLASQKRSVLCVDLNLEYGGVETVLGLEPKRNLIELLPVIEELTTQHLAKVVQQHESGLHVLASPADPEAAAQWEAAHVQTLLYVARAMYDVVLVDCPPAPALRSMVAMGAADRLVQVVTPDAPAVRTATRALQWLQGRNLPGSQPMGLVVNRTSQRADLSAEDVASALGLPVWAEVRADFAGLQERVNRGMPLAAGKGRRPSGLPGDLFHVAETLVGSK